MNRNKPATSAILWWWGEPSLSTNYTAIKHFIEEESKFFPKLKIKYYNKVHPSITFFKDEDLIEDVSLKDRDGPDVMEEMYERGFDFEYDHLYPSDEQVEKWKEEYKDK